MSAMIRPLTLLAVSLALIVPAVGLVGGAVPADEALARHVVMVIGAHRTGCTGTAISQNLVLTAAHCVPAGARYGVFEPGASRRGKPNSVANLERHPLFDESMAAMESWKWEDEAEGIRYCGAHSTSWDTAFGMRAMLEAPRAVVDGETASASLKRAYGWLRDAQMQTELPDYERERREPIKGGWCFSDGVHRWAVSDCTAEAITALMEAHDVEGLPEVRTDEVGLVDPFGQRHAADERDHGLDAHRHRDRHVLAPLLPHGTDHTDVLRGDDETPHPPRIEPLRPGDRPIGPAPVRGACDDDPVRVLEIHLEAALARLDERLSIDLLALRGHLLQRPTVA